MEEEMPQQSHLLSICAALGGYEDRETDVEGIQRVIKKQYVMGDEVLGKLTVRLTGVVRIINTVTLTVQHACEI